MPGKDYSDDNWDFIPYEKPEEDEDYPMLRYCSRALLGVLAAAVAAEISGFIIKDRKKK